MSDLFRRGVDVTAAAIGLVVLAPLFVLVALLTRIGVGPGVLFRQQRIGRGGRPFELLKFRTMRPAEPGRSDPAFDAERTTAVGRFLRSSSLDEIPSLVNLLRGEIALVGPRPLPVWYWDVFRDDEYERFHVRPGITGLAQVNGRNQVGWDARLAYDVEYVRTRTLRGDGAILRRTVGVVLGRSGVDHGEGITMVSLVKERRGSE